MIDEQNDEKQEFQYRQQVLAYKYGKIENEKLMFPLSREQMEAEKERLLSNSMRFYHDKVEKNEEFKLLLRERMKQKPEQQVPDSNFSQHTNNAVERRRSEIEMEMKRLSPHDPKYINLKIENLFLASKEQYLRLKDTILGPLLQEEQVGILQSRMLERNLLDRNYFRRDKPQRKLESRLQDKFELNMIRHEQAKRKKLKYKEFMQSIFAHQIEFFEFHRKKLKHCKKRGLAVKHFLEQKDSKLYQIEQQKLKEQRLNALRQGDIGIYLGQIEEAKKERVMQILQQTDQFLKDIGAKVKIQKGEEIGDDDEVVEGDIQKNELGYDIQQSKRVYYKITHRIEEEITTQPSLLEGGQLKPYQIQGLQWLVSLYNNNLNGILADEMGLGKTIQTISLICFLIEFKKNFGPFLIIVPLSTLSNWSDEFDKWAPSVKKVIYKGSPQQRKELSKLMKTTKWNLCLTTYEYVLKDRLALSKHEWKYIIVDEGHRMKNYRSKFALTLGQQYQSDRRLLLTGTPLQNNMAELWALLNFLLPKVFSSCEDFEKWFTLPLTKLGASEKDVGIDQEEQLLIINRLHQVLRPFLLRRVKREVEKDLPRKTEYVIKIELSAWQKKVYSQIKERGVMTFDQQSGKTGSYYLQNLMMQLRKICNHPYLFLDVDLSRQTDEIWRSSGKFELLDRILPKLLNTKHRMLIFSQFTQLMNILEAFFEYRGWPCLRLDGGTKSDDRKTRIQLFSQEDSQYNVFLLSTRAGGLGLNLQSADTVILFDSDWNPMMDLQAQDRAYRIGQKNEVRVYRLVTATQIEQQILSKAEHKMGLDQVIIQAGLFNQKSTDSERKERLEDFFNSKNKRDEFLAEDIPNDEQINEWIARTEDEYEYFNELDRVRYEEEKLIYKHFQDPGKSETYTNYRLIQEDEVPGWINQKVEVQEPKVYGKGMREKNKVNYYDDQSDQFQIKENDEDEMKQEEDDDSKKEDLDLVDDKIKKKKK